MGMPDYFPGPRPEMRRRRESMYRPPPTGITRPTAPTGFMRIVRIVLRVILFLLLLPMALFAGAICGVVGAFPGALAGFVVGLIARLCGAAPNTVMILAAVGAGLGWLSVLIPTVVDFYEAFMGEW